MDQDSEMGGLWVQRHGLFFIKDHAKVWIFKS